MKARAGVTFIELILAGAILATISAGALIGMLRISRFTNERSQLMVADGFCWDVAWKLFNEDYNNLADLTAPLTNGLRRCEIKGRVLPKEQQTEGSGLFELLSQLQYPGSPPICYITLSNACDEAGEPMRDAGVCIGVNLEWGPQERRSILFPRNDVNAAMVYNHPVSVFRSSFSRRLKQ